MIHHSFFMFQLAMPIFSGQDRRQYLRLSQSHAFIGLQKAWSMADNFLRLITGYFREAWIDIFNFASGIGNDDFGKALFNGLRELRICSSACLRSVISLIRLR